MFKKFLQWGTKEKKEYSGNSVDTSWGEGTSTALNSIIFEILEGILSKGTMDFLGVNESDASCPEKCMSALIARSSQMGISHKDIYDNLALFERGNFIRSSKDAVKPLTSDMGI